jgi:DNA-binding response OmpR family regulator
MIRILVVEDDQHIAELVQYNLNSDGLDVSVVYDGGPALAELRKGTFDLLVLDLMLPTISGLEVCKAVRRDPALMRMPILVVTARGEEAVRSLAFSMGANDYLTKPFTPRELVARVRSLLRSTVQA